MPDIFPTEVLYAILDDRYGFNDMGEWSPTTVYAASDIVSYGGNTFRALVPNSDTIPVNGSIWARRIANTAGGAKIAIVSALPATLADNTLYVIPNVIKAPNAVNSLAAAGGNTQVVLTWLKPGADITHSAATNYDVIWDTVNPPVANTISDIGDVATYTKTGLSNGTAYYFKVVAKNAGGSTASAAVSSTPTAVNNAPNAPSALSSDTFLTNGTGFTLHWTNNGDPDAGDYVASNKVYKDGVLHQSGVSGTSLAITGLTAGSSANWTVSAVDSHGLEGAQSEALAVTTLGVKTWTFTYRTSTIIQVSDGTTTSDLPTTVLQDNSGATSITTGTGSKTLTMTSGSTPWRAGQQISMWRPGSNDRMVGTVTSWNSGTKALVLNITAATGSSTSTGWYVLGSNCYADWTPPSGYVGAAAAATTIGGGGGGGGPTGYGTAGDGGFSAVAAIATPETLIVQGAGGLGGAVTAAGTNGSLASGAVTLGTLRIYIGKGGTGGENPFWHGISYAPGSGGTTQADTPIYGIKGAAGNPAGAAGTNGAVTIAYTG